MPTPTWCWQGPEWLRRHAEVLEELANACGAADLAPDVADVEAVLHEQGVLVPEWAERWRERWRASLAASTTAHTVLLHVAALQARDTNPFAAYVRQHPAFRLAACSGWASAFGHGGSSKITSVVYALLCMLAW